MRKLSRAALLVPPVAAFAGRKVVVVGDLVADQYIYGEAERVSREAPVLIVRWESAEVKLGGAANAAANLAALGAEVTAVGVVGRDEVGGELRELFAKAGIKLVSPRAPGLATETKTRIMAGGHSTRRQQVLRLDRAPRRPLSEAVQRELADLVARQAPRADALLVSDYGGGVLAPPVIEAALDAVGRCPVCVDSRYNLAAFAGATALKPNEVELEALTGVAIDDDTALLRALAIARRRVPGSSWVVTRGRQGMAVADVGKPALLPAHGGQVAIDVTGAGDTVGATLTLGLASGLPLIEAARIANVAGALKVQKVGTVPVRAPELSEELSR